MDNTARSPADNNTALPRPGEVVAGKYRVDSVIGTGGMGIVMGALDMSLGRPVAIKFLSPHKVRREGAVPRFEREARAAASIQSEHVVRIFEVGTLPNGSPYIVMEHLRGGDLAQCLQQRGPLPLADGVDFILQACEALGEAHGRGIVHRDLKPQNLFLTNRPDGSTCIKVLDFGISKANDEEAPNLTSTDTVMGTPLYMSPEQVRSLKNVDQRADIWALGSILFELLTASPIFEAPSATALCAMIAMDPPTPLRARRQDASPELEAAILRCLHKDPNGRFQDVAALAEALSPFATERGRASATRISRVVRGGAFAGGSVPPPMGSDPGGATTVDGSGARRSQLPMGTPGLGPSGYPAPPMIGPSGFPPGVVGASGYPNQMPSGMPPPTTQQTWQRTGETGATGGAPRSGAGPIAVALLGMLTGLVLLGLVVGGYFLYASRIPAPLADNTDGGGPKAVVPSAPGAAPPGTATATGTSKTGPGPKPGVVVVVDGGAPVIPPPNAKDGGAPAPPGPAPPAPPKKDPDLESKKRLAEGRCSHQRFLLSQNDPKTNQGARDVKQMECLQSQSLSPNSGAANCDRQICRSACSMLQDQQCIQQLDFAERNNPLPF